MGDRQHVLGLLESGQEEDRLRGLKELALLADEVSLMPWIFRALGDESWRIRKEAVEIFMALPGAGKQAGEIIKLLYAQDNTGLRNAAVETLVRLGRSAVPQLLYELSSPDHDVRKFVLDVLGEIGDERCAPSMIQALQDPDSNVRSAAAENLGKIRAVEAVPALLAAMVEADLWLRFTILQALAGIGGPVPMAGLQEYRHEKLLRKPLFDCLGRVGNAEAIPCLVQGLGDAMRNVREAAVMALEGVVVRFPAEGFRHLAGLAGSAEAAAVAELLHSGDLKVRRAAVRILGQIGDERFVPGLLDLLDDEEVGEAAGQALLSMDPSASRSILTVWEGADDRVRTFIACLLGELPFPEGLELLMGGLFASDPGLRMACARSLGKIGTTSAISPLSSCLEDTVEEVRDAARQALFRIGPKHPAETLRIMRPLLTHDDPELRMNAVSVLGRLDGHEVAQVLALAVKDESPLVRRTGVKLYGGKHEPRHFQALMLALTDEDVEVRRIAAEALGSCREMQAVCPLELALQDEDIWVRAAAVRALGNLGGEAAVSLVQKAVADPTGLVAIAALETLSLLASEKSFSLWLQALGHEDEEVVTVALKLLAASGRKEWLPEVLDRMLNHRHWEVRRTFARLLVELAGAEYREQLEGRLLVEKEELAKRQFRNLLDDIESHQG